MLENLTERFEKVFDRLRKKPTLTQDNIEEGLREIRLALLEADVNYNVVNDFVNAVRKEALGEKVIKSVSPTEQFIKVVFDKLKNIMGDNRDDLKYAKSGLSVFLMVGLQGSGKTTTCAKLAKKLSAEKRILLVAADTYRPAAQEQLKVLAEQANVGYFAGEKKDNPVKIVKSSLKYAEKNNYHVVIIDTAGRLQIDNQMMKELEDIKKISKPSEILFVSDSMAGQNVVDVVTQFDERLSISGVILTKFDSDTRGGAALSIKWTTGKSIKLVGVGEKLDELEVFYPDRIASRILGKGDIISFVEKAQQAVDLEEAERLEKKLKKNQFDLEDFLNQIQSIKKMGSLQSLMAMIPGFNKLMKGQDIDDNPLSKTEAIILSMTPKERRNYKIIVGTRRKRIADGSGTTVQDVTRLLSQFDQMQKVLKKMKKNPLAAMSKMGLGGSMGDIEKMMQQDKGGLPNIGGFDKL